MSDFETVLTNLLWDENVRAKRFPSKSDRTLLFGISSSSTQLCTSRFPALLRLDRDILDMYFVDFYRPIVRDTEASDEIIIEGVDRQRLLPYGLKHVTRHGTEGVRLHGLVDTTEHALRTLRDAIVHVEHGALRHDYSG